MEEFVREHATQIGLGAGLVVLIWLAVKLLSPKKKVFAEGMTMNVRCRGCRWKGTVTKYNMKCPKCASADLQLV